MKHQYQVIDPSLKEHIRSILLIENFSASDCAGMPVFPFAIPALIFLRDNVTGDSKLYLLAESSFPAHFLTGKDHSLIAYFFKPFTAPILFGLDSKEFKQHTIDFASSELISSLDHVSSPAQWHEIIVEELNTRIKATEKEFDIIRFATDYLMIHAVGSLNELYRHIQVSERTLQRLFRKYVGITPVQFRKICRFQSGFSQLRSKNFSRLSDIAFENGYSDQSHYVRSFREFTDITPGYYLSHGLERKK